MEPKAEDAARWLRRYALFDRYADLAARGLCTLPEAVDSYLWELGVPAAERRLLARHMTTCLDCRRPTGISGSCGGSCGSA